ncbi:ABC transporter permease [Agromyces binzhouensis]|uniref:ABC transporter permease n=1 Tax=Agromyces binzhouensis TaxID=1817495 RepID=UPI003636D927
MSSAEASATVGTSSDAGDAAAPAPAPLRAARRQRRGGLASLFASETATLFRRWRTWAMLAALGLIPILIAIAIRIAGPSGPGRGPAFLDQVAGNGLFVGMTALVVATPLFLPLTIAVVSGDAIAGEASHGTLRYLLIAPAGRLRLLAVKYAVAAVFCVAAALTVIVVGTLIGWALFPVGPVTLLSGGQIPVGEGLLRLLAIGAYVAVSMLGLSAIGLLASTLTVVPVGAMAATAILAVVAQIVGAIPQLESVHPFLFSDRWFDFADLLRSPPSWESFADNALLQAGWIAVFGGLAAWRFATRDILS